MERCFISVFGVEWIPFDAITISVVRGDVVCGTAVKGDLDTAEGRAIALFDQSFEISWIRRAR